MSAFLLFVKRFIENENIYIDNGTPVLFFETMSRQARVATMRDLYIINPAWASIMDRFLGWRI